MNGAVDSRAAIGAGRWAEAPLGGVIAAALTPVTTEFEVDVPRLAEHARRLLGQGCSFVSLFGTTGEGPSFGAAEKQRALSRVAAMVGGARLIPAAIGTSADEVAAAVGAAAAIGCRAVLVTPPYYYGAAGEAGIVAFFDAVTARLGGAWPIDLLLYHIPALTRVGFTPAVIARLVERIGPRLVGIKDSTGVTADTIGLAKRFAGLRVFTGDDRVLPNLLAAGGAGLIGGMPNLNAANLVALFGEGGRETPRAAALLGKAAARIAVVDAAGGPAALKTLLAAELGDAAWARLMPPLTGLGDAAASALARAFAAGGFPSAPQAG